MLLRILGELVAVAALWGITNPLLRLGSEGIDRLEDTGSPVFNFLQEVRLIGRRLNYWVPFLLNQCGSLLYIWTLRKGRIVSAVPVANSLTLVFTALAGYYLGEGLPKKGTKFVNK